MSDATEQFFEELGQRGYEPLVAKFSGRVRFDVVDGRRTYRWLVAIDKGDLAVSREGGDGDCTIRADKRIVRPVGERRGERDGGGVAWRADVHGRRRAAARDPTRLPGPPRASVPSVGSGSR